MNELETLKLKHFQRAIARAREEIGDTYSTGSFSDAKSAIYALPNVLDRLGLADFALHDELKALARECWDAMHRTEDGGDDVYARAGRCGQAVGVLMRRVEAILEAG
ncbi:MAG: hypothetical protein ACQES2_04480 [Pseudomonadota bacterium]